MKNQTAEEILDQFSCIEHDGMESISYQNANIAMHQFASQQSALAVVKRDDRLEPLIYAMNDYITLLGKELDDCVVMLSVHGWQSKRVQEGIDARNKILEIKKSLSTPTVQTVYPTSAELSSSVQMKPSAEIAPDKKPNQCKCTEEDTSGWTTVKCCNICGLPIQSQVWDFVQVEPTYTEVEVLDLLNLHTRYVKNQEIEEAGIFNKKWFDKNKKLGI